MVMPRKRITLSLNDEVSGDKAILDFLSGLPKRTRSEIMKEILFEALDMREEKPSSDVSVTTMTSDPPGVDPDEIIEKLF